MYRRAVFLAVLISLTLAARGQTQFVRDTFTDPNGTLLESHTPDVGGAWSRVRGRGLVINSNRIRPDKTTANDVYVNAAVPPSAEYVIGFSTRFIGVNSQNYVELYARGTPLTSGYAAFLSVTGAYSITRYDAGVATVLVSGTIGTVTTFVWHEIAFLVTDASKSLVLNGTVIATTTDNTITSAGLVGFGASNKTLDDVLVDDFYASTLAPTVVEMDSIEAVRDEGRVLLSWTTGRESDNLGYRVWRETPGRQRVLLTPSPIAGSAFFVSGGALGSGNAYRWMDRGAPRRGVRYWIEELDVHGGREWHGPIVPSDGTIDQRAAPAPTLGQLAQRTGVANVSQGFEAARGSSDATNFDLARRDALKIAVTAPGIHELPLAALPTGADAKRLQLWEDGREVPILLTRDAIRFYGTPLDTPASGTRVYWLTWDHGRGTRIAAPPPAGDAPLHGGSGFAATIERREKSIFAANLESADGDGFFGPVITNDPSAPARQTLHLEHIDRTAAHAELALTIQGATAVLHRIAVTVNGNDAGVVELEGMAKKRASMIIPAAWLRDGDNEVALVAQNGFDDVSAIEAVRVTYQRRYQAGADGTLLFTAPGGTRVPMAGFGGEIVALDITNPAEPQLLASAGSVVTLRGTGVRTVIATERPIRATAEANVPSTLHRAKGDLVMIAPRAFLAALAPLAARRGSVVLAAVEDVYDEFSFGAKDPNAIRAFLGAVRTRAVLLAGDGSYDPRNYVGGGAVDVIPVKLVWTRMQRTPSDAWYTDFDHDGTADLPIGRLPARTADEVRAMVAKILAYEDAALASRDVLFVNGSGFAHRAAQATAHIDVAAEGIAAAREHLLQRWAGGAGLITFFGHGSVEIWERSSFFARADAASLRNARLPLVSAMTCLNGYFHDVAQESLAEALMRNANGGAAAVWALSTLTETPGQLAAHEALTAALLSGKTLGEATVAAQRATNDPDVRRTLLLFGDPTMKMKM